MSRTKKSLKELKENEKKVCELELARLKIINEKYLEMLKILKKHYNLNSLVLTLGNIISISINKDDKDFKKVKEWLENE